jgi:hypothetical protein
VADDWQEDIDDAPSGELLDIWIEGLNEPGWVITGYIIHRTPYRIDDPETGCPYWPHESGGYPTRWRPPVREPVA